MLKRVLGNQGEKKVAYVRDQVRLQTVVKGHSEHNDDWQDAGLKW